MRPLTARTGIRLHILVTLLSLTLIGFSTALGPSGSELTYYTGHDGNYDIYRIDVEHGLSINLTNNPGEDVRPAWSPDSQHLTFYSYRNQRTDLHIMNADGSQLHRLAESGGPGSYPAWSPDGQWIAFASIHVESAGVYRLHPDGSSLQRLTMFRASYVVWSPDGHRLILMDDCDNNCDLYVVNADGTDLRRLTNNGVFDVYPIWSPDSQQIVFMSNRDGNMELYWMSLDCTSSTARDGCLAERLTTNRAVDGFPNWSPDGKWIAFSSDRDGNFEIYTLDTACLAQPATCTQATRRLTDHEPRDLGPVWSPDSRTIAFIAANSIYVMNADGSGMRELTHDILRDQTLVWRP